MTFKRIPSDFNDEKKETRLTSTLSSRPSTSLSHSGHQLVSSDLATIPPVGTSSVEQYDARIGDGLLAEVAEPENEASEAKEREDDASRLERNSREG